jgi:hypothetical protein
MRPHRNALLTRKRVSASIQNVPLKGWITGAVGLAAILVLVGCGPKSPEVRVFGLLPHTTESTLFLVAARQKEWIAKSLRSARFELADDPLDAALFLRVTVGNEKSFRQCGTRNNVKYALRSNRRTVLEVKASGWTGSCEPNVFDDMSRRLRRELEKRSLESRETSEEPT